MNLWVLVPMNANSSGAPQFNSTFPDPSSRESHIAFALPGSGHVQITIYDVQGRMVRTLVDGARSAGAQSIIWNGRDQAGHEVASGPYFARLTFHGTNIVKKIVLAR